MHTSRLSRTLTRDEIQPMKRVLVIAYQFPPVAGMGSHRILRLVRHLHEVGWEPVVMTGQVATGVPVDPQLLDSLPANVEVHRVPSLDLTAMWAAMKKSNAGLPSEPPSLKSQGFTTFLNRWMMVPDKVFPWIRPAVRAGERLVRDKQIHAIYSTSDPYSDHLVALRLARRHAFPWIAEFRDLWLGGPYFARSQPTSLHRAIHGYFERRVVTHASSVVCVTRGVQRYFDAAYPESRTRLLYNSFDSAEYGTAEPEPDPVFTILYAGAFYSTRSPAPFFAGWARFLAQHRLTPGAARIIVIGGSSDLDLGAMASRFGIAQTVQLVGRVPHAEALRRMRNATALLAVQAPEDDISVPGKLFEYIGARRPLLFVGRPCEPTEMIVRHRLGWVARPDAESVAEALSAIYSAWRTRGHAGIGLPPMPQFSARSAAAQLARLLEEAHCGA